MSAVLPPPAAHPNPRRTDARRADAGFGDFFRYHGWLSPGVRLFRQLGFPAKSACVALAFLVPLVVMLAALVGTAREQIRIAESERSGVAVMRPYLALIEAAQARRHAAVEGDSRLGEHQQRVRAAFSALEQAYQAAAAHFTPGPAFAALAKEHAGLMEQPVGADRQATFDRHDEYVDALLNGVRELANVSTLALDPDLDTFHLMNVAVLRGPAQLEAADMVRTLVMMAGEQRSITPVQRDAVSRNLAIWAHVDDEIESSYQLAVAGDEALQRQLGMPAVDAAAERFITPAGRLLAEDGWAAGAGELPALGAEAVRLEARLVADVLAELDRRLAARIERVRTTVLEQLGLAALGVAVAAYLLLCFYRVMMGGLREVDGHLREISRGNLTTAPRPWGRDEAAQLMTTMGEMQTSLRRIVGIVLDSASNVSTASEQIASASRDLSVRTEQAAASLQETSATMEQIAATVQHTAHKVAESEATVAHNATAAAHGGEVIRDVVATMAGIQASSQRIGEIVGTIDGIAFQTNILALNAAVEAARAGEQGRGFAVVAGEVRALAQRSAEAAREIKSLIAQSTERVDAGARVAADAGVTIEQMVDNARRIGGLFGDIAGAAKEQSAGVGQVSQSVQELDRATQQNATLVEETAAASRSLSDQAQRLSSEVAFFRLV